MRRLAAFLLALILSAPALADGINIPPVPIQGSWTPTITSAGGGTPTYSTQTGFYEQIGRQITVRFTVVLATAGTLGAGNISVGGLPVTAVGTGMCSISQYSTAGLTALNVGVGGVISDATTSIGLVSFSNTATSAITVAQAGATAFFIGYCTYKAS